MFKDIKKNEILIIAGKDKISKKFIFTINKEYKDIKILVDETLNLKKIIKLFIKNKNVSVPFLISSFIAERLRENYPIPKIAKFSNKEELIKILDEVRPKLIIVFRGSFIFTQEIIEKYKIINIHCADINNNKYKGLGSIFISYHLKEQYPKISVHKIESNIDSGEILLSKDYKFNFEKPYRLNEDIAYEAGINSVIEILHN